MIRATPSNTTMTATASAPTGASPALAAFLRGSGRRALLFAQLQSGDARRGDAAALAALPRFAAGAAELPMAQWPRRFWAGLLAEPALRPGPDAHWAPPFEALAGLGPGARAALLLWLVAGLGEEEAAAALGVEVPAWRQALRRAAPLDAEGQVDAVAWRAMESEVREALRHLPPERLAAWDEASAALWPAPAPVARRAAPRSRARRWLVPLLALCALALAATFLWAWYRPAAEDPGVSEPVDALVERKPLPERDAPPSFDPGDQAALLLHPDFDLLVAGGDTPLLRELDFQAWYAARRAAEAAQEDDDAR